MKVGRIHAKYPKYSVFDVLGVRTTSVGEILMEDILWNQDGTYATMETDALVMTKLGQYTDQEDIKKEYKIFIDRAIYRRTNNVNPVPNYNTGGADSIQVNVQVIQFPQRGLAFNIGYLELDGHANLQQDGGSDAIDGGAGQVQTIVWKGCDSGNDLRLAGTLVVENLILTDEYQSPDDIAPRSRIVNISDDVTINSITNVGPWQINLGGVGIRNQNGQNDWHERSNIVIRNADLTGGEMWIQGEKVGYDSDEPGYTGTYPYMKVNIYDSRIENVRNYITDSGDGQIIDVDPSVDFLAIRDHFEFNIYNSVIRCDEADGFLKNAFLDTTNGFLMTTSTRGATDLSISRPDLSLPPGTLDLPSGEWIASSRLVNSVLLDLNEAITGNGFTTR